MRSDIWLLLYALKNMVNNQKHDCSSFVTELQMTLEFNIINSHTFTVYVHTLKRAFGPHVSS